MVNGVKYLLIYSLILALPLLLRACITTNGFSYFWEYVDYYAVYFLIGIIASFGKSRIQNLALLFQVGASVYWLLRILGSPLLYYNDMEILRFLSILVFIFLFYFWYLSFEKLVNVWQIFIALLISVLLTLTSMLYDCFWDFTFFYISCAEAICDNLLIILGLIMGAILCSFRTQSKRLIAIILYTIISFFSSVYLSAGIVNLIRYGSLSGKIEKPVSLSFCDADGNLCLQKNFKEKYSILFLWDNSCSRHLWAMHDLERYYWKYKNNNDVRLYVVSVNQVRTEDIVTPFIEYDSYNFNVPLYITTDSTVLCKELGADCRNIEFVCLLRNDTLVYRNTMLKVGEYLDETMRKTQ